MAEALRLTREMRGGGGTEMMQGIRAVLADPIDPERVRIVVMLTDGYIGNEDEIAGEVGRRAGDQLRFWTVGIGSSPNRHLLDGVARQGGGASAVLGLQDDPAPLVGGIMDRIQRAQLSRLRIDWGGLDVMETYPARLGELWAGKPVFLLGRYRGEGAAQLTLSGLAEGEPVSFEVPVTLAAASLAENAANAVLAPAWARKKIEHLGDQMAVAGASFEMEEEVDRDRAALPPDERVHELRGRGREPGARGGRGAAAPHAGPGAHARRACPTRACSAAAGTR